MLKSKFEDFLRKDPNIQSKEKAVATRVSKGSAIEKQLSKSLDQIVENEESMFDALKKINQEMPNSNGGYSNALRKYYEFTNGRKFPKIRDYTP